MAEYGEVHIIWALGNRVWAPKMAKVNGRARCLAMSSHDGCWLQDDILQPGPRQGLHRLPIHQPDQARHTHAYALQRHQGLCLTSVGANEQLLFEASQGRRSVVVVTTAQHDVMRHSASICLFKSCEQLQVGTTLSMFSAYLLTTLATGTGRRA